MTDRVFEMRLGCSYQGEDNQVEQLDVQTLIDGEWQELELGTQTAGFQIFAYAVFTCQHLYFRTNAAERNLLLASSKGRIQITTDESWNMQQLHVSFRALLRSGMAHDADKEYIAERMGLCPVSRNLRPVPDTRIKIVFDA